MGKDIVTDLGVIEFSRNLIANLAGIATTECFGVVGVVSTRLSNGINELLGRESLSKGVDVTFNENALQIRVSVVVSYGIRITTIADNIISNIRYTVEKHTGLTVDKVEVNVQGIRNIN